MKRSCFVSCALSLLITFAISGLDSPKAYAASGTAEIDAKAIVGIAASELAGKYGSPGRKEPSEYGFTWYVYNQDYKNYFMAGIRDDKVVAVYATASTLCYGSDFGLKSIKSAVRTKLGTPLSYIRSGNTIAILPDADQRDKFAVGDNFVTVFYDLLAGSKVTSIMIIPQDDETAATISKQPLSSSLLAAYQRISVDLINAARARNGLKTLSTDELDNDLAAARSADMAERNYFSHYTPENENPSDLAKDMGLCFTSLGENIAFGNSNSMLAHESFMNSSEHRSNILKSSYIKVGAGASSSDSMYVVLTDIFSNNTAKPTASDPINSHDVNGDGIISISDYTLIRLDILGIKPLSEKAKAAADINGDGVISISDYTLIRLDILGIKKID
jgi:uncharacterized protein YkwD